MASMTSQVGVPSLFQGQPVHMKVEPETQQRKKGRVWARDGPRGALRHWRRETRDERGERRGEEREGKRTDPVFVPFSGASEHLFFLFLRGAGLVDE